MEKDYLMPKINFSTKMNLSLCSWLLPFPSYPKLPVSLLFYFCTITRGEKK